MFFEYYGMQKKLKILQTMKVVKILWINNLKFMKAG